jgi:uridine kinase
MNRAPTLRFHPPADSAGTNGPLFIAIAGGSGAGKSWLAERLQTALGRRAARLSIDDFYRDRSRVPPSLRARLNFDHPRAIAWTDVEKALSALRGGRAARLPCYDFKTHCRTGGGKLLRPGRVVLVEGLWLWRRRSLRRFFQLRIFVDSSARTRLRRRLTRDMQSRGRTRASVIRQFRSTVEPMYGRFVAPQIRHADMVLPEDFSARDVQQLAQRVRKLAG